MKLLTIQISSWKKLEIQTIGISTVFQCYTCGEEDHFSPNCPHKKKKNTKRKKNYCQGGRNKTKICLLHLRRTGTFSPNCPQKETKNPPVKSYKCFDCGEEGHWKINNHTKKNPFSGACQEEGHFFKDGPDEKKMTKN